MTELAPESSAALPGFWAIVPAGGAGTRLWPLSRQARPKFLLDLTGSGRTLLQQTWDRLVPLAGAGGVAVVTGAAHAEAVIEQLPGLLEANLLTEPTPRDSAAAICLAAAVIMQRDPDAVVGSFAADHVIRNAPGFEAAVADAVAAARHGEIVTLGIEPDHASTAFGYIKVGEALGLEGASSAHRVERFVEKPDADTAAHYLEEGGYRWNAGMFVARADVLMAELERNRPELYAGVRRIAAVWDTDERQALVDEVWPQLEKVAIDYAIAEPAAEAGRVAVVPATLGWDDIGDWASLAALLPGDAALKVVGDAAQVLDVDSSGIAVPAGERLVAVLGLKDVVVIDTPSAVLVTTREWAQDVKKVVETLTQLGRHDLR
ncbi:mannose-1-phosphate guanylyltransferase [Kineosporia sp. NBRC 101731]|uniref:mannose-1-phosphate guanylyltransferase n=1 Tax=Kineosporia sp. NBRC 101731 TaxID=3032199 RepID=UPI0025533B4A|nr:mannose-1-phosphate guanylyltransferase [Kineosporia sp. NBRC 101731]